MCVCIFVYEHTNKKNGDLALLNHDVGVRDICCRLTEDSSSRMGSNHVDVAACTPACMHEL
jgi:hypothetical protein